MPLYETRPKGGVLRIDLKTKGFLAPRSKGPLVNSTNVRLATSRPKVFYKKIKKNKK